MKKMMRLTINCGVLHMKRFFVNEVIDNREGKILYYYKHSKNGYYTDIIRIDKYFYWELTLDGKLSEEEIHKECFYNIENQDLGYSSDDIGELEYLIPNIVQVHEKYQNELLEF